MSDAEVTAEAARVGYDSKQVEAGVRGAAPRAVSAIRHEPDRAHD